MLQYIPRFLQLHITQVVNSENLNLIISLEY